MQDTRCQMAGKHWWHKTEVVGGIPYLWSGIWHLAAGSRHLSRRN